MLDIQVNEIVREVKKDGIVVGMVPDISLGSYTPLAKLQVLCIADEMAELGAEKTEQLTKQLTKVGILDAFMQYVKALSFTTDVGKRWVLIEQMKMMRSRYADILNVAKAGQRSTFWDFFQKREMLMKGVAEQITPIQLMGVLMHAHSEYLQTQDDMTRSFLARGILAGVETLNNQKIGRVPQICYLLRDAARQKRQEFPYQGDASLAQKDDSSKVSFGCWYNPKKQSRKVVCKGSKAVHYGDDFASRYGHRSY